MIDDFLLQKNWIFQKSSNHILNLNVAYFAPSSFLRIGNLEVLNILQSCTLSQLNFVFTKSKILQSLANLLNSGVSEIVLEKMNEAFFLELLQSFTQGDYLRVERECWLCNRFIHIKKLSVDNIFYKILKSRIDRLQSKEKKIQQKQSYKVALFITGQLRGFETAIPRMKAKFEHLGDIDAYVSTWDEVGYTRFNLQNAYRIFDKKTSDFIIEQKDKLDLTAFDEAIYNYTSKLYSADKLQQMLQKELAWCQSSQLNIKNYQEYPYNKMSNSEKMYYHNSYWIETLGQSHFEHYDLIIRIRPDYFFKDSTPVDISGISNTHILADTDNYLVQEWGFGMGDQLWIGIPQTILPLMLCHDRHSLSYRYMQMFYAQEPYQGHLNCGLQAWFAGLQMIKDNSFLAKSRLSSTRLICYDEFLKMNIPII